MQFKFFESRRLTLRKASPKDLKEYKEQLIWYNPLSKDKLNIIKDSKTGYVSVCNEDSKMVGLIQIDEIDECTVYVKVSIPNKSWIEKYGKEAVHQFIKCCQERKLYNRIYMKQENSVIDAYKKERPETFEKGNYVDIVA